MYSGFVTIVHRYGCVLRNDQRNNDNQNIGVWMQNGDKIVLLESICHAIKNESSLHSPIFWLYFVAPALVIYT